MSYWWPYWRKRRRTAQVTGSAVLKRRAVARTASIGGSAALRPRLAARTASVAGSAALSAPHPPASSGSRGVNLLFWRTAKD